MFGVRSEQFGMAHDAPSDLDHSTAPVLAFSPYTQSFSVATITVLPTTSGCAYTWPSTGALKTCPNCPPSTAAWVSAGSFGSHPSRRLFCAAVVSSPAGAAAWRWAAVWVATALAGPAAATAVSPAADTAVTSRTENDLRARLFPSDVIGFPSRHTTRTPSPAGRRRSLSPRQRTKSAKPPDIGP